MAEDGYCNDDNKCHEIKRQYKELIKKTKIIVYNLRDLKTGSCQHKQPIYNIKIIIN